MPIPTGNFQKSDSYAQSVGRGAGGGQELTGKLTGGAMSRSPYCSERALVPRCYATNVDSRDLLREVGRRRLEEPHLAGMVAALFINRIRLRAQGRDAYSAARAMTRGFSTSGLQGGFRHGRGESSSCRGVRRCYGLISQAWSIHPVRWPTGPLRGRCGSPPASAEPSLRDRTRCDEPAWGSSNEQRHVRSRSRSRVAPGRGTRRPSWRNHYQWARPLKAETRVQSPIGRSGRLYLRSI